LSTINYTTKGTTINNSNPGVFFYWAEIKVMTGGSFTVTQSVPTYTPTKGTQYFAVTSGSFVYTTGCTTLSSIKSGGQTTTFSLSGPGTYIIGIKYSAKSIVGSGPAGTTKNFTYPYTFQITGFSASLQKLNLVHS
jgi:hypothetical protein